MSGKIAHKKLWGKLVIDKQKALENQGFLRIIYAPYRLQLTFRSVS